MVARPVRLLFICIGNTCRSPLAAGVAAALLGPRVHAESAGITETGRPATPKAIAVLKEHFGIDLTAHRSRHLDEVTVAEFDCLIALDPIVYAPLCERCPVPPSPILLWPLDDPYLEGLDAYRRCLTQLQATIKAHTPQLLGYQRSHPTETTTGETP
jgi:protein-tyrosine-phosphatase